MAHPKITILFVDDEDALRQVVQEQLTLEGYEVDSADDGDTAVEKMAEREYNVVLLDIRMPRMNGIDVLKHIKEKRIYTRVIMLTGVDDLTVAMEAVKNGANDYITKPYDLASLVKCIKRVTAK
jgi:two-component system response regulator HydG